MCHSVWPNVYVILIYIEWRMSISKLAQIMFRKCLQQTIKNAQKLYLLATCIIWYKNVLANVYNNIFNGNNSWNTMVTLMHLSTLWNHTKDRSMLGVTVWLEMTMKDWFEQYVKYRDTSLLPTYHSLSTYHRTAPRSGCHCHNNNNNNNNYYYNGKVFIRH